MTGCIKIDGFVLKMMNLALKVMNIVLNMMNLALIDFNGNGQGGKLEFDQGLGVLHFLKSSFSIEKS